jgi:sugar phosphate isomerase/epimerase
MCFDVALPSEVSVMQRRSFLQRAGQLAVASGLASTSLFAAQDGAASKRETQSSDAWPVAIFTKVFQTHTYDQLAEAVVQIGADGIEAPLRRGGHIEPARIGQELPRMIEALAKRDKRVLIAATDIVSAGDETAQILKAFRDNGVTHYRLGYYRYADGEPRLQQVRRFAEQAQELAKLNEQMGVVGIYQNHAGDRYLGSVIWDLAMLLEEVESPALGVALDLRHLRAEIGVSWRAMIDLIRPHVLSVFAKNSTWTKDGGLRLIHVPLDQGMADKQMFRSIWKEIDKPAPLSVHVEYLGQDPLPPGETAEMIAASRHDVTVLRSWMKG